METKVIEIDSTFRDREQYKSPTDFRIDVNMPDKYSCVDSYDPVSNQAALVSWIGNTLDAVVPSVTSISGTVVEIEDSHTVIVNFTFDTLFTPFNYYRGCRVSSTMVNLYEYLGGGVGRFGLVASSVFSVGDIFHVNHPIPVIDIGIVGHVVRLFVPSLYSCQAKIVYNETLHTSAEIVAFNEYGVDIRITHSGWQYNHVFSLRREIPATFSTIVACTSNSVTMATGHDYLGDVVYIPRFRYYGRIANVVSPTELIVSERIDDPASCIGLEIQTLDFAYDNNKSLRYIGTSNQQERTWQVSMMDVQIPNRKIVNAKSLTDYSTLYLEFRDRNNSQDNIMTNNPHGNNALFRLTADTSNSTKGYFTYSCPKLYKTFRFSPNRSYFFVRITTPEGEVVRFKEDDNTWPLAPKRHLQINVSMVVKML